MKKNIKIIILLTTILLTVQFIFTQKETDHLKWQTFASKKALVVEIQNIENQSSFYRNLTQLADFYQANIIKTVKKDDVIINALYLTYPQYQYYRTKQNNYITVENTEEEIILSNIDEIKNDDILDLFHDDFVTIMTLKTYLTKYDITGKIYIDFYNSEVKDEFQYQLSRLYPDCHFDDNEIQFKEIEFIEFNHSITVISLLILLGISLFYYGISQLKTIGIYKLTGLTHSTIYAKLFFRLYALVVLCTIIIYLGSFIFIKNIDALFIFSFMKEIILLWWLIFLVSFILYMIVKKYTVNHLLKKKGLYHKFYLINIFIQQISLLLSLYILYPLFNTSLKFPSVFFNIVLIAMVNIFIHYYSIKLYIVNSEKRIAIKRLSGYSLRDSMKEYYLMSFIISILSSIFCFVFIKPYFILFIILNTITTIVLLDRIGINHKINQGLKE